MPILTDAVSFKSLHVSFYMKPEGKLNKLKSQQAGYAVYDDIEKVQIRQAGDQKFIGHYNAHDPSDWREEFTNRPLTYAEVYEKQYEQFKAHRPQVGDGTPIESFPDLTPAKLQTLKSAGIHTVEALAAIDGANLKTLGMFGRELKDKATDWLERTKSLQGSIAADKALSAAEERIAKLEAKLTELTGEKVEPSKKPMESGSVKGPTPFDDWTVDTIRVYLSDNEVPSTTKMTKAELIALAMQVAEKNLKSEKAA